MLQFSLYVGGTVRITPIIMRALTDRLEIVY
jgi:hypothetical protein